MLNSIAVYFVLCIVLVVHTVFIGVVNVWGGECLGGERLTIHSTQISSSHSRQSWIDWMKMRHHLAWKNSTNVRHFRLIAGVHCPVSWPESKSGSLLPGGRHTHPILNQKPETTQKISFRFFFLQKYHMLGKSQKTPPPYTGTNTNLK